jgi:tetratricopeptide (TPR) repeat protein
MKTLKFFTTVTVMCAIVSITGCFGQKIIVPAYDTALEQYAFAKKVRDRGYLITDDERRHKQFKHAIIAYDKVLTLFPDDQQFTPLAIISKAECHYAIGNYKKSAELYEKALELFPDQSDIQASALYGAADAYDQLGDHENAQFFYKECIERFKDDERPLIKAIVEGCELQYGIIKEK